MHANGNPGESGERADRQRGETMTRDLPDIPSGHGRRRPCVAARRALLAALFLVSALAAPAVAPARAQEPGVRREGGLVYFNLQNVDIRSALDTISQVLGISYVLGGSVPTGTPITISTAAGIPLEKVPDLLDSVLRTYNLALIKTGDVFTVIQAGEGQPAGEVTRTQVYVYYLRNANAVDVANVLSQLFQGSAPAGGFVRRSPPAQGLSRRLEQQNLPYADTQQNPFGMGGVNDQVPQATEANTPVRVIQGELVGQTSIVPDETTNSLIIKTAPENYPSIQETIAKLDMRPAQVLIEVTIAEITLDKSMQFGIEYLLRGKTEIGGETVRGELELQSPTPIVGGLRAHVFDSGNVDVVLRALAADARVNVLSTPRVLAVNNHEARILIGSEVPFVQFSRATTGEAIDQVVQYRNVGLELTVTPRINPDRYISMDLLQQVSALTNDVLFDAPIITTREAQTSLVVGDNQTIVLGGLMEDRKEKRRNGIPILKDIPVLGWLFGTTSERTVKTELVLTLTPYIVESDQELQRLRQEIESHSELYQKELEKRREEGHFVPGDLTPERMQSAPVAPAGPAPTPTPLPADTTTLAPRDTARAAAMPAMGEPAQAPVVGAEPEPRVSSLERGPEISQPAPEGGGGNADAPSPSTYGAPSSAGETPEVNQPAAPSPPPAEAVEPTPDEPSGEQVETFEPTPGEPGAEQQVETFEPPAGEPGGGHVETFEAPAGEPGGEARQTPPSPAETGGAPETPEPPLAEPGGPSFRVQVMAVPDQRAAEDEADRLRGILGPELPVYVERERPFYKVRVGDFPTKDEAHAAVVRLRGLGYNDAWTVTVPGSGG
jgi:type II secretory pathway component GspD/PulD (secretin)